jgi:hypothetical protein
MSLDCPEISALDVERRAHCHEPIRILRQGAQQFYPFPSRKRPSARESGPGDKVQLSLAHELRTFLRVMDKFDFNAFLFEKAELNGRDSDET